MGDRKITKETKEQKRAAALRENLLKRKQTARDKDCKKTKKNEEKK